MTGYYDLVLGLIPVTLLGITGLLHGTGVELTVAVPVAAAIAAGIVGHALFVNAPVDPRPAVDDNPRPAADGPHPAAD